MGSFSFRAVDPRAFDLLMSFRKASTARHGDVWNALDAIPRKHLSILKKEEFLRGVAKVAGPFEAWSLLPWAYVVLTYNISVPGRLSSRVLVWAIRSLSSRVESW